jgi:hypothetical protein
MEHQPTKPGTGPPAEADEAARYRQKAAECWEKAMACQDPELVAGWLDLAAIWNDLVWHIDRRRAARPDT